MGPLASDQRRRSRRRKTDPKQAVALIRASTDKQDISPKAQADAIARYAHAHGLAIVASYSETASGAAALADRPGLQAALGQLRGSSAGVLLVAKHDRLSRDPMLAELLRRELAAEGVAIVSADGVANGDAPTDTFLRDMLGAVARFERELIRGRTRAALSARKARGLRTGSVPFGFELGADGESLQPNASEQAVIERVRLERSLGMSYRDIANGLQADGVPARGERWHVTTIARLLQRQPS